MDITFNSQLDSYRTSDDAERTMVEATRSFVRQFSNCFERSLSCGHITGSSWIVDRSRQFVLLTHHQKLDRWLQLGGHCDGDADVLRVALREAREESGLQGIRPISAAIFDIDVHPIPARGQEPAHLHYDIRFLLEANRSEQLRLSDESKALAWVSIDSIPDLGNESLTRMARKTPSPQ